MFIEFIEHNEANFFWKKISVDEKCSYCIWKTIKLLLTIWQLDLPVCMVINWKAGVKMLVEGPYFILVALWGSTKLVIGFIH